MVAFRKFKLNKKELIFVGVSHSPNNQQINKVRYLLNHFCPQVVLVEGGFETCKFKNEIDAIKKGWEIGFASYYASSKGIILKGNDPPQKDCVKFTEGIHGKDLAFLFFCLRNMRIFFLKNYENFQRNERMGYILEEFKKLTKWKDFDYSPRNFKILFKKHLGSEFEIDNNYPEFHHEILQKLSNELDVLRDNFLVKQILELLPRYNKIFIIKGNAHLTNFKETIGKILYEK